MEISRESVNRCAREYLKKSKAEYLHAVDHGDVRDYVRETFDRLVLEDESKAYADDCYNVFCRWLKAAACAPFNTLYDCETFGGLLVIAGPQGIGKTRLLSKLIPDEKLIAMETCVNPADRDSVMVATSFWGVELGEITSTMDNGKLKAFFTATRDTYREPYARELSTYPRNTFYYSTTNDVEGCKEHGAGWEVLLCVKDVNLDDWSESDSRMLWGQLTP